jgi:hypothetical protein
VTDGLSPQIIHIYIYIHNFLKLHMLSLAEVTNRIMRVIYDLVAGDGRIGSSNE